MRHLSSIVEVQKKTLASKGLGRKLTLLFAGCFSCHYRGRGQAIVTHADAYKIEQKQA